MMNCLLPNFWTIAGNRLEHRWKYSDHILTRQYVYIVERMVIG